MKEVIRISARQSLSDFLREVWVHRELLLTFVWRDLKVRYSQTALGLAWALIQPLVTIGILVVVFGRFIQVDMGGIDPLPFIASGVLCWGYFSFVFTQSGQSVVQSQNMIKKVYFPKLILPLSKAFLGAVDLVFTAILFLLIVILSGVEVAPFWGLFPLVLLGLMVVSVGVGIWVSALAIRYRDFLHVQPFIIQLGMYVTPVVYPSFVAKGYLPDWAQFLYYLNPVAGVLDLLRWVVFQTVPIDMMTGFSLLIGVVLFVSGVWYFQIVERKIADLV